MRAQDSLPGLVLVASALVGVPEAVAEPGITASLFSQDGHDTDEALDFAGSHPMLGLGLGYRFRSGTEAFAEGKIGLGGHEAIFTSYSLGLRQRLRLGSVEPFAELALAQVSDSGAGPLAVSAGGGLDFRLNDQWAVGIAGGHYFSDDEFSGGYGALDWYARAQLTFRFGSTDDDFDVSHPFPDLLGALL